MNTFGPGSGMLEGVIPGTSKQHSFGLKYLMAWSMLTRAPRQGQMTFTPASVHLSNTTAKRRGIAKQLLG